MLNDNELAALTQPIINIYSRIEYDLIVEIARRFDTYDEIGGSLEWQLKKLDELGTLNADAVKTIARFSEKSQSEIVEMLKKSTFANIDFDGLKLNEPELTLPHPRAKERDFVMIPLAELNQGISPFGPYF